MTQDKRTFKNDIECAERNLLIASWIGIVTAISVIVFGLTGIL